MQKEELYVVFTCTGRTEDDVRAATVAVTVLDNVTHRAQLFLIQSAVSRVEGDWLSR